MEEQARLSLPTDVMDKILELLPPPPPPGPKLIPCIRILIKDTHYLNVRVSKAVSEEEVRLICDELVGYSRNKVYWKCDSHMSNLDDIVTNALMLGYTFASPKDEISSREGMGFTMYRK